VEAVVRDDMDKVVTERPRALHYNRYNSFGARAKQKRTDHDELPNRESMSRGHCAGYAGKEFSDLISPLERFIHSSVGKNWDKLYSEICQKLPVRSLSGFHIVKQHLYWMVDVNPIYHDREYYHSRYAGAFNQEFQKGSYYVDKVGILREGKTPRTSYSRLRVEDPTKQVIDGQRYHLIEGIWYEMLDNGINVFTKETIYKKRQLNRKELRMLGLQND